jgi:hypothetical protein
MASGSMVLGMGDTPRVVWDTKGGMENPANCVVDGLGLREGLVTALVSNNPDTSGEQASEEGVESPQRDPCNGVESRVGKRNDSGVNESLEELGRLPNSSNDGEVPKHVN